MFAEFSIDRCAHAGTPADADLTAFNSTCYEFVVKKGGSFQEARNYCKGRGGDLVHGFKVFTIRVYIYSVLLQHYSYINPTLINLTNFKWIFIDSKTICK